MQLIDYLHLTQPELFNRQPPNGWVPGAFPSLKPMTFGLFGRGPDGVASTAAAGYGTGDSIQVGSESDGDPYRSGLRTGAGALAGSGVPVVPKPRGGYALGARFGRTSPLSLALREVKALRNVEFDPPIWSPTLGNVTAGAADLGILLGRATPAVALALLAADVLTSRNRGRALAGDAGSTIGGTLGGAVGVEGGPPGVIGGSLLGASLGQSVGEHAYDGDLIPEQSLDAPLGPYQAYNSFDVL